MSILREIVGYMLRDQNVPGITAIHNPLGDIDSSAYNVPGIIHIRHFIDRPAMNAHPDLNVRMFA
jgi:hypothetical protein